MPEKNISEPIQDRIKELRRVRAKDLIPNKKNWRVHNDRQSKVLRGVLDEIGYASALVARETEDGQLVLIDGHLRAQTTPDAIVPVLILDVTEEESDKLLSILDPLTEMADTDYGKLEALLGEIQTQSESLEEYIEESKEDVTNYLDNLQADTEYDEEDDEEEDTDADESDDEDYEVDDNGWTVTGETEAEEDSSETEEETLTDSAKNRTARQYHLADIDMEKTDGRWGIPILEPTDFIPTQLIDFDECMRAQEKDYTVHFFIQDSRFERVWKETDRYIPMLQEFGSIIVPDFSFFEGMPQAIMLWNVYRAQLFGQIAQREGITVIPRVRFGDESTYDFCFAGIPKGGTVAVSTVSFNDDEYRPMFIRGVAEMIRQVNPSHIVVYGTMIEEAFGDIPTTHFRNTTNTYRRENS